jgi:hypothetical protein
LVTNTIMFYIKLFRSFDKREGRATDSLGELS